MVPPCHISQSAHSDDWKLGEMTATQQYVLLGLRPLNDALPFGPVFLVKNGVPGRGLAVDRGVDISTGTRGAGVPLTVTCTVVPVIFGSGVGELGVKVGVGEGLL
jgi:hypothetical protein